MNVASARRHTPRTGSPIIRWRDKNNSPSPSVFTGWPSIRTGGGGESTPAATRYEEKKLKKKAIAFRVRIRAITTITIRHFPGCFCDQKKSATQGGRRNDPYAETRAMTCRGL
mgnify:CR=1 FL=1